MNFKLQLEKINKINHIKPALFYLLGVLFLILFYFTIFNYNNLYILTDGIFPPSSAGLIVDRSFFLWQENALGFFKGIQFFEIVNYLFSLFGLSASNIQHIITFLLFLISYSNCFILLRYLKKNYLLILIFSLIYTINDITFGSVGACALMLFYSFVPIYMYFILKFFREHSDKKYNIFLNSFLFSVALAVGSTGTILLFFVYLFFATAVLIFSLWSYFKRKIVYDKLAKFIIYTTLFFILFTLPFFINLYCTLFVNHNDLISNYKGVNFKFYFDINSYKQYFDGNILIFLSRPFVSQGSNFFILFPFFVIFVIFYFLFFPSKKEKLNKDVVYFSKFFIIIFGGIFLIILYSKFNFWLFEKILIFQGFMNPQKWSYVIASSCIVLFYIAFSSMEMKYKKFTKIFALIFLIATVTGPYIKNKNETMMYSEVGGGLNEGHYISKKIDSETLNMFTQLNTKKLANQRVACFPEEPDVNLLCLKIKNSLFFPTSNFEINNVVSNNIENKKDFINILKLLNYRYIVVFKKIGQVSGVRFWQYGEMKQHIVGSPQNFISIFNDEKIFYESDSYIIFQLNN